MSDSPSTLPQHIALIMDGNRRWARQHGLQALQGHDYVSEKVIEPLVDRCIELGIPYLTLWAFSTENWKREQGEVEGLMQLFRKAFNKNSERLFERGVKLNAIGDLSKFPEDIQQGIQAWINKSKENKNITVTFALNYGGRDEILRAMKKMIVAEGSELKDEGERGEVPFSWMSEEAFAEHLDTAGMPDPDLIIRPGGEQRLSGYLTWQSVYAELYFTDVLMPDFSPAELDKAVEEYQKRQRRFGK
jgi:undecaprenyl diphosphate synthase